MSEIPNPRTAEVFDAMVTAYDTWAEPLSTRLAQAALRKTTVSAGDRVLDIGAGTGALSVQAAALGASVTAIDLSSAMVARLNQRLAPYPKCKALVMDGQALTFEDDTFDAAFSVLSTTLFSNWSAGLDESVRVLDPIFSSSPTYRLLDEAMKGELRVLLAREARRWVEEDSPAGRTAHVHLALARRSGRPL